MTHEDCLEAIVWLQNEFGGTKIGNIFGHRDQWLVSTRLSDNYTTLILGFAQGRTEARIKRPRGFPIQINISNCESLAQFKKEFTDLITQNRKNKNGTEFQYHFSII